MIKNWSVQNFKSIGRLDQISFSPITVVAGANSSGKSSILQSILVLKQTTQYGADTKALSLNGPILKLGTAEDIHHSHSEGEEMSISLTFELPADRKYTNFRWSEWSHHLRSDRVSNVKRICLKLDFAPPQAESSYGQEKKHKLSLTPVLDAVTVTVFREETEREEEYSTKFVREPKKDYRVQSELTPKLDRRDLQEIRRQTSLESLDGGRLSHFLPLWCWGFVNTTLEEAKGICKALFSGHNSLISRGGTNLDQVIEPDLARNLNADLDTEIPLNSEEGFTFADLRRLLHTQFKSRPTKNTKFLRQRVDQNVMEAVNEIIMRHFRENVEKNIVLQPFDIPSLSGVADFIASYLKSGVRYLGPLRDAPRPVYQPEAIEDTTSVGYKGEHTAAVFELNKDKPVIFVPPPVSRSSSKPHFETLPRTQSLEIAVASWLEYLGVAHGVASDDEGVYGNTLRVSPRADNRYYDLTNVGVGVSQVLPVVVEALLAEPGALLILEQPELHLHPKVQARLADFFIALEKSGRRILVETHSEYLIDRFRLRIAEDDSDKLQDCIKILFASNDGHQTNLEEVVVNEFGAIANWPKDFFDQSQSDANEILRVAREKRINRKKTGG